MCTLIDMATASISSVTIAPSPSLNDCRWCPRLWRKYTEKEEVGDNGGTPSFPESLAFPSAPPPPRTGKRGEGRGSHFL